MLEYRGGGREDAEAIALLHARSWRENYRGDFDDAFLDGDLPGERLLEWSKRLADPPDDQFVRLALDGSSLVGFVCVVGGEDPTWGSLVDNLHVAAECKGQGIGRSLMLQAGAWLGDAYPERGVYLWVLEANVRARRFYERMGGNDAGASVMQTHGGAVVRSCRYTWARPARIAATDDGNSLAPAARQSE